MNTRRRCLELRYVHVFFGERTQQRTGMKGILQSRANTDGARKSRHGSEPDSRSVKALSETKTLRRKKPARGAVTSTRQERDRPGTKTKELPPVQGDLPKV